MISALILGLTTQSSLLFSGIFVYWKKVPDRISGILGGLGAGALLSAIAFDLVPQADSLDAYIVAVWALIGAAVFLIGDFVIDRKFSGGDDVSSAMGIIVGSVVDGVPESLILGMQVASGDKLSIGFVAAIFLSNIPQAVAPSVDLRNAGWSISKTGRLWAIVVLACGIACALGYFFGDMFSSNGDRMAALATGGLLAMLTNSLMPFSYERAGKWAGVATVVGFFGALALPS